MGARASARWGVGVNGLAGVHSAEHAVKVRNADGKAKAVYERVVIHEEWKTNVAVPVATKKAADKDVIAAATNYCSSTAIATVDVYHKFGFPVIVWGAVLPDITYRNKYAEVHRVNGTMINQNDANADLVSKLGYKTVAVIHDTTDYGKGHNEYFSKALPQIGKAKIVDTFADADEMHRQLMFLRQRHQNAAARGAVDLGHHDDGDAGDAMKSLNFRPRVLSDGGLHNKQTPIRGQRVDPLNDHTNLFASNARLPLFS